MRIKLHGMKYNKLHKKVLIILINYDQFFSQLVYGQELYNFI